MNQRRVIQALLLAAVTGLAGGVVAQQATTPAESPASGSAALAQLRTFSAASQELYKQVSASLIRVKVEQDPVGLIPPALRKEFQEWREKVKDSRLPISEGTAPSIEIYPKENHPKEHGERSERPDTPRRGNMRGPRDGHPAAATTGTPRMPALGLALRFMEERSQGMSDPELLERIRAIRQRVEAARSGLGDELIGVVTGPDGEALVLTALPRDGKGVPVTLSDGTETTATVVGSDFQRNVSIIKLEKHPATPIVMAEAKPSAGELLLCVTAHRGAAGWIVVPSTPAGGKKGETRFATLGDEHGAMYLFNVQGQLSAVGFDRHALPIVTVHKYLEDLAKYGAPHRLGVSYRRVDPDTRRKNNIPAGQPALLVHSVVAGSPAQKAGLHEGDILVSIDKRPLNLGMLPRVLEDIATRTSGTLSLGIVRDGKEMSIDVPLSRQQQ